MSVFRVDKHRDFTVIANYVFKDHTLSAKAKGILVEMLSLPENWDYTLKGLQRFFRMVLILSGRASESWRSTDMLSVNESAMQEVALADGICHLRNTPHGCGKRVRRCFACFYFPEKETPTAEIPTKDLSAEELATQYNTNISRTNLSSTYESNPNQSNCAADAPMDVMGYDEGDRADSREYRL